MSGVSGGPKRTHCRKALVTICPRLPFALRVTRSETDSLPKGIGDEDVVRGEYGGFDVSETDSLPKGIGDDGARR